MSAQTAHKRLIAFHIAAVELLGEWEALEQQVADTLNDGYPFPEDFGEVVARIGAWRDAQAF